MITLKTIRSRLISKFISPRQRLRLGAFLENIYSLLFALPLIGDGIAHFFFQRLKTAPRQLNIEITSICNANCIMCPREAMNRPKTVMSRQLYEKILSDAVTLKIQHFALNGYGEIFTAKKDYRYFISRLLERIPTARITINSNASLLDEEVARFLIESKVDTVHVDIDGATAETFEAIRRNLRFDTVTKNVRRLLELRHALDASLPKVRVGIIRQPANELEADLLLTQWAGVADYVSKDFLVNRGGSVNIVTERSVKGVCSLPWFELNIFSDGSVVICCDDWNAKDPIGSLSTQTVSEVWNSPKFRRYRALQAGGRAKNLPLCSQCNWARPGPSWFSQHVSARYRKARDQT